MPTSAAAGLTRELERRRRQTQARRAAGLEVDEGRDWASVAAAIPEALSKGAGSETVVPMASAIVGGVTISTLLTLFVVPCAYEIFSRFEKRDYQAAEIDPSSV